MTGKIKITVTGVARENPPAPVAKPVAPVEVKK